MSRSFDTARAELIAERYQQGFSAAAIGREMGMKGSTVGAILKRIGVELRSRSDAVRLGRAAALGSPLREHVLAEAGACGSPVCTDPECSVAPGHCHRPGCHNKAATARKTQLGKREVKGLPLKHCTGECAQAARAVEFPLGGCGSPTCSDDQCGVPHGQCHNCGKPAVIAKRSQRTKRWVKGLPTLYCSPECASAHAATPASVKQHARERETLEADGLVPATKVGRDLSRLAIAPTSPLDVERRTFGRRVRLGVKAHDYLQFATDNNAQRAHAVRGTLTKPLAASKGSKLGAPRKLSAGEVEHAAELERDGLSSRKIADELNKQRPVRDPVTHTTVRAALAERRAVAVAATASPL